MDDNKFEKIRFVCGENKIKFQMVNRLYNHRDYHCIAIRKKSNIIFYKKS